jgi:hypothetical protein
MKNPKVTTVTVIKQCRATTQRVKIQPKPAPFVPVILLRKASGDVLRKQLSV